MSAPLISPQIQQQIDQWLIKYPVEQKQSAVMHALRLVQEDQSTKSLTPALMDAVADYLEMDKISVYEVAKFYSMYKHQPQGKYKISICTNISCQLSGCDKIIQQLENRLNIKMGETTADGRYTLEPVECMAACSSAPVCQINDRSYQENLTTEKVENMLSALDKDEDQLITNPEFLTNGVKIKKEANHG